MEELGAPDRYHAAHLIAHRFGGDPGLGNLVPLEDRANTSYMKVTENEIAALLERGPALRLFAVVRPLYRDPPTSMSEPFRARRSLNPRSRYRRQPRQRHLLALSRVRPRSIWMAALV